MGDLGDAFVAVVGIAVGIIVGGPCLVFMSNLMSSVFATAFGSATVGAVVGSVVGAAAGVVVGGIAGGLAGGLKRITLPVRSTQK